MALPTATISWTRRPCRLLRWAASLRSRVALHLRVERRALAVLPPQSLLAAFLDAPTLVAVARIVGTALPVHPPLEPADRLGIGYQLGAKHLQAWGALAGDDGNRGRPQVQTNGSA